MCELEFDTFAIEPVARFYGYGTDGMAGVFDLSAVRTAEDFENIRMIEDEALPRYADVAKYIYVAARKPAEKSVIDGAKAVATEGSP
jgi:hypothetical protein